MKYIRFIFTLLLISANSYSQLLISHGPLGSGDEPSQLLDSLFAYYPLDESFGNFIDAHGSRDLTASGTLTYSVSGRVGTCITFVTDGQGKHTPDDWEFDDDYSISCWVKTASAGAYKGVVTYYGDAGTSDERGWNIRMNAGGSGVAVGLARQWFAGGNAVSVGTTGINDDGWHHIVYTFNNSDNNIRIYTDGSLEDTDNNTTPVLYHTNCDFRIGSWYDDQFFDGEIDEVAVYRGRALSQGAIDSLYNSGNGLAYPLDF